MNPNQQANPKTLTSGCACAPFSAGIGDLPQTLYFNISPFRDSLCMYISPTAGTDEGF
jgi:hypothetical protein